VIAWIVETVGIGSVKVTPVWAAGRLPAGKVSIANQLGFSTPVGGAAPMTSIAKARYGYTAIG